MRILIFAVVVFSLESCRESVRYEVNNEKKINKEIVDVVCILEPSGDRLSMIIARCDSHGKDNCQGAKVVDGTIEVLVHTESTKDTLKQDEVKEGVLFFKADRLKEILERNDRLIVRLKYQIDSLSITRDKIVLVFLDRKESHNFAVH